MSRRTFDLIQAARAAGVVLNVCDDTVYLGNADPQTVKLWGSILRPIRRQVLARLLAEEAIAAEKAGATADKGTS